MRYSCGHVSTKKNVRGIKDAATSTPPQPHTTLPPPTTTDRRKLGHPVVSNRTLHRAMQQRCHHASASARSPSYTVAPASARGEVEILHEETMSGTMIYISEFQNTHTIGLQIRHICITPPRMKRLSQSAILRLIRMRQSTIADM